MRRIVCTLGVLALVGCGDSSGPSVASVVGTWNLETINGQGMPFTVAQFPGYHLEILDDVFVVRSNGTFTETLTIRETEGSTVTTSSESADGDWDQDNAAITLNYDDGSVATAAISGDVVTANIDGDVFVYRRQ